MENQSLANQPEQRLFYPTDQIILRYPKKVMDRREKVADKLAQIHITVYESDASI